MEQHAKFIRGPETTALIARLRQLQPGESITESALSLAVGFDVTKYEPNVYRARDIILRDAEGVIDRVEGGWRRLTDSEAVRVAGERYSMKARNASVRGVGALTSVQYDSLLEKDKIEHNVRLSTLGALRLLFKPASRRLIEKAVTNNGQYLPDKETLKLFEKVK